jgi:hypothetical protein
MKLRREHFR